MHVALLGSDPVWQELLRQEGVSYALDAPGLPEPPAILIVDRTPKLAEVAWLRRFAASNGCVMAFAPDAQAIWRGVEVRPARLGTILPDDSLLFRNLAELHVHAQCGLVSGATCGDAGRAGRAVFAGRIDGCACVLLPFSVPRLLGGFRTATRVFPARTPKPVFEKVAAVNRGEVRRLVANGLRFLSWHLDLPYVHLGYLPPGQPAGFGLRIDTDDDGAQAIAPAADLARQLGSVFTWFLATRVLGADLDRVAGVMLTGQDVQYHCFRHLVHDRYAANLEDFAKGVGRLRRAGVRPAGAAAPYGEWNETWCRAAAASGIEYSSEFCVGYDDLPFRPIVAGMLAEVLQVPVHPVCSSRLTAAGADHAEIAEYFRRQVERQAARSEPCFLYDHPGKLMRVFDPMRQALQYGAARCGGWLTLTDYSRWWQARERASYDWTCKDGEFRLAVRQPAGRVALWIEWQDGIAEWPFADSSAVLSRIERRPGPEPVRFERSFLPTRSRRIRATASEFLRTLRRNRQKKVEATI